jgi:hypothetical protein
VKVLHRCTVTRSNQQRKKSCRISRIYPIDISFSHVEKTSHRFHFAADWSFDNAVAAGIWGPNYFAQHPISSREVHMGEEAQYLG